GESYVVFGGAGVGASGLVDVASLDGSNGFALIGIDLSDQSGRAVTGGLDLNGDGAADLVTGALFGDPGGRTSAGETFVVFGGSGVGASGAVQLDSLSGADGFVLNGVALQDQSARSVASAGDVNGDGIDDLIVGADQADVGAEANAGTSYVVFGSALPFAASVELSALDGTNGFAISGIASGDLSGIAVAGAGDVNGDGFSDLVIGAERADPGGQSDAGEAYVVFGGADPAPAGILDLALLDGAKGFVVPGPAAFARLGASVAAAGDVDQDGFDDVIIGATAAVTNIFATGAAYVLLGDPAMGASGSIDVTALDGYDGFVVAGIDSSDFAGASVAHAGDLNGDGVDDFAVGAIGADPNGNSSGEVYVILGRPCDACLPDPAPEPGVLTGLLTGVLLLSRLPRRGTRAR
ncbi:MAG: integrin alpha, partial [Actinomycetota bacterium]|nr:integrin alpha [Actinomycetota bacterium]